MNETSAITEALQEELWTRLNHNVEQEEFEMIMQAYRDEERLLLASENDREQDIQKVNTYL